MTPNSLAGKNRIKKIFEAIKAGKLNPEQALRLFKQASPGSPEEPMAALKLPAPASDPNHGEMPLFLTSDWVAVDPQSNHDNGPPPGPVLLFCDDARATRRLQVQLKSLGPVCSAKRGSQFKLLNHSSYELDTSQMEDFQALARDLDQKGRFPRTIIFVRGWQGAEPPQMRVDRRIGESLFSLFYLYRSLKAIRPRESHSLLFAFPGGTAPQPQFLALNGFLKSLFLEDPRWHCKSLEVALAEDSPGAVDLFADQVCKILERKSLGSLENRYANGRFYERKTRFLKQQTRVAAGLDLREHGTYLITGGLGGLGYIFARYLAPRFNGTLVLVGRSPLDPSGRTLCAELGDLGPQVIYRSVDVSDRDAVFSLIAEIRKKHGGIHGVIHGAGVTRDGLLIKETEADLQAVLAPKVYGCLNLDEALAREKLDFMVFFSSMVTHHGNAGQAGYVFANSFLDHFAQLRESKREQGRRFGRTFSFGWSLWREGTLRVAAADEARGRDRLGLEPLTRKQGLWAFETGLGLKQTHALVLAGDSAKITSAFIENKFQEAVKANPVQATTVSHQPDSHTLAIKTEAYLKRFLAKETKMPLSQIHAHKALEEYSIDSMMIMNLTRDLETQFGPLSKTLFYEYQNLTDLAGYFIANHREQLIEKLGPGAVRVQQPKIIPPRPSKKQAPAVTAAFKPKSRSHEDEPIAIVGMAGRYPMADDLDAFWENLKAGKDCITEIPGERWDYRPHYHPDKNRADKTYSKWGGFIDGYDQFDALFFNISPKEAELMDPQERLFLETVWRAMEDAGYTKGRLSNQKVGVFVGVMYSDYQLFGIEETLKGHPVRPNSFFSSIANRVSYFFNLRGPSLALDTLCSSSLTAIHLACESIRRGESVLAIAGGVNLTMHPSKYITLSHGKFAASDGKCHSFGEGGDGYVPGEGVGSVFLKPLSKALADGDRIHGVIRGTAINHGGKTNGPSVPNPNAQADCIAEVLRESGVDPRHISYLEAHGTGTSLGDPIEITGLTKAFKAVSPSANVVPGSCAIGSVKSNIGHAESAAGIAGLTKVLLQMRHRQLVPSLHSDVLNPNIDFSKTPFLVQRQLTEWNPPTPGEGEEPIPLLAGLSSFGAGGSNAHLILEAYPNQQRMSSGMDMPRLILLSARNQDRLQDSAVQLAQALDSRSLQEEPNLLDDVAYTLQVGRTPMACRLALLVDDLDELCEKLVRFAAGERQQDHLFLGTVETGQLTSMLLEGEAGSAFLAVVMRNRDLSKLGVLWVGGLDADWRLLHGDAPPRLMSLPGHPFVKERFWVPTSAQGLSVSSSSRPHPLLGENTSTLREQKFTTVFDGSEFFFQDHKLGELKVLPAAVILEMARAAGHLAEERPVSRIEKVTWARPVMLRPGQDNLTTHVSLLSEKQAVLFELSTGGNRGNRVTRSKGTLVFEEDGQPLVVMDLAQLKHRCGQPLPGETCYGQFLEHGIAYGPGFQVIQSLWCGDEEALARLALPQHLEFDPADTVVHPALLDGALQTVLGLQAQKSGESSALFLPFSLDALVLKQPLATTCYVYVRHHGQSMNPSSIKTFDLSLLDDRGRECALFQNLTMKAFPSEGAKAQKPWFFYQPVWVEEAVAKAPRDTGVLWVFTADARVENFLSEGASANQKKSRMVAISAGSEFLEHGANRFTIRPDSQNDFRNLVTTLAGRNLLPRSVLHLWAFKASLDGPDEQVQTALKTGFYCLFHLSRALIQQKPEHKIQLLFAYPEKENITGNLFAATTGLLRTLHLEYPRISGKTVALRHGGHESGLGVDRLRQLMDELAIPAELAPEVRFESKSRLVKSWRFQPSVQAKATSGLTLPRAGSTVLITGGMGQLGWIFAQYLAQKAKLRLVLTGRSPVDEAKKKRLALLAELGSQAHYIPADVSQESSVIELMAGIKNRFGRLDGVIHAAGVVSDAFLIQKTEEEVARVLAPKVLGTLLLDKATREEKLDFFVLFSTLASGLGNYGQSDYAFANHFLDRYAQTRTHLQSLGQRWGKTLTLSWPLWRDGGMEMEATARKRMFEDLGWEPLSTEHGIAAFEAALAANSHHLMVLSGDQAKIERVMSSGPQKKAKPVVLAGPNATGSDVDHAALGAKLEDYLKDIISVEMKLSKDRIASKTALEQYGLESVMVMNMTRQLERDFGELSKTLFFEYQTVRELRDYFLKHHREALLQHFEATPGEKPVVVNIPEVSLPPQRIEHLRSQGTRFRKSDPSEPTKDAIAIIGVSGRYPMASNLNLFWENLKAGKDCISEIPEERWDYRDYYQPDTREPGKCNSKWGGFLDDADKFDSLFFNISPREARMMDPQERIFLEAAWHTLEDAGYTRASLSSNLVGVFVGVMYAHYQLFSVEADFRHTGYTPSSLHAAIANRVSYALNFRGPSMAVDTMCSSSLTAFHLAVSAIQRGECELAIAGGVNLSLHPNKYLALSVGTFTSSDGRCRSFGEGGDGYVPGEGVGAVLLKPLSRAMADGDQIYGVVKGCAINHGGKTQGYSVPNPAAQSKVISSAFHNAGLDSSRIGYVEAHGTGTSLGDPIEISGLSKAFGAMDDGNKTRRRQPVPIGSVKSNIGHLESAAGIAAIHKVLLQFKHKTLVPSLHADPLNANINFGDSHFSVQRTLSPWSLPHFQGDHSEPKLARQACISSFGAGGSNAHFILEEPNTSQRVGVPAGKNGSQKRLILLSARNEDRLRIYAGNLARFIQGAQIPSLGNSSFQDLEGALVEEVARLLDLDPRDVDPEDLELGICFEPLTFSQLTEWITQTLGIGVSVDKVILHQNLRSLGRFLHRETTAVSTDDVAYPPSFLDDLAFTLQVGREAMETRLALVVGDVTELKTRLEQVSKGGSGAFFVVSPNMETESFEALQTELYQRFTQQDWEFLAGKWLKGLELDWWTFYQKSLPAEGSSGQARPRRISLPTYPFVRRRHWLPRSESGGKLAGHQALHPFIDDVDPAASHRLKRGLVFRKMFRATDPILRDHRLDETGILAGVCYLEMAHAAASQLEPDLELRLEGVVLMRPLFVTDSKLVRIHLREEAKHFSFEIRSDEGKQANTHLHAQGRIIRAAWSETQRLPFDLESFKGAASGGVDREQLYEKMGGFGIHYGPTFRLLERVWYRDGALLACLGIPPEGLAGSVSFRLHPGLLDGALQSIVAHAIFGKAPVEPKMPFSFEGVSARPCHPRQVFAHIVPSENGRYHITLLDESGSSFVKLTDVSLRSLKPKHIQGPTSVFAEMTRQVRGLAVDSKELAKAQEALREITALGRQFMLDVFQGMDVFQTGGKVLTKDELMGQLGIIPEYFLLFLALLDILEEGAYIRQDGADVMTLPVVDTQGLQQELANLSKRTARFNSDFPDFATHLELLRSCSKNYSAILRGEQHAMDVEHPDQADMVEAYAKFFMGNALVDRSNELVGQCVVSYIRARSASLLPDRKIKIIEIGGGTGGLTETVLNKLDHYQDSVEYLYTDVGVSITERAEKRLGTGRNYVAFQVLNIEKDLQAQGIAVGSYDLVLADNVVHATTNVRGTLKKLKSLLRPTGVLVLSELTRIQDFYTICMGILDGWWRFEDDELRLKNSTLLGAPMWMTLLEEQGFNAIGDIQDMADGQTTDLGHRIFLAEAGPQDVLNQLVTDVRVPVSHAPVPQPKQQVEPAPRGGEAQAKPVVPTVTAKTNHPSVVEETNENIVLQCLADALNLEPHEIDRQKAFADYGVDSIIGVELINTINQRLAVDIRVTALFDYGNLNELAGFITQEYGAPSKLPGGIPVPAVEMASTETPEPHDVTDNLFLLEQLAKGDLDVDRALEQLVQTPASSVSHPFIDAWDREPNGAYVFGKTLKLTDPVLSEHLVLGRAILPGVGYLEMAHAAGILALGTARFCLAQVTLLRPIEVLSEAQETKVVLRQNEDNWFFEIFSIQEAPGQDFVCTQGYLTSPPKHDETIISIDPIREACSRRGEASTLYGFLEKLGIHYGPSYRCITQVWMGADQALAHLSLPSHRLGDLDAFTFQPMLMDSALQVIASLGMFETAHPKLMLPFSFDHVAVHRPLEAELYAHVKRKDSARVEINVFTTDGNLCIRFNEITLREVPKAAPPIDFLFLPNWRITKPLTASPIAYPGTALIFEPDGTQGLDRALSDMLGANRVERVQMGQETRLVEEQMWLLDTRDPDVLDGWFKGFQNLQTIVLFAGFRQEDDPANLDQNLDATITALFRMVKSLLRLGFEKRQLCLKIITHQALAVLPDEINRPLAATLHGFSKSLAKEVPAWSINVADVALDGIRVSNLARTILSEPAHKQGDEVVFRKGARYVRAFSRLDLPAVGPLPFKEKNVYLILGGAGAIGIAMSRYLAQSVKARLVWIGRSELNKAQKAAIVDITLSGGQVLYIQADATNLTQMERAVSEAKSRFGAIHGAIHSAMYHRDKPIVEMDEQTLRAVMAPKLEGGRNFYLALRHEPLDLMVFFSSGQSFWGNAFQSHYAAACAFEEAFAHYISRRESFSVKIIHWGFWGDVGKGATKAYKKLLASQGVFSISSQEGIEAFERIAAHSVEQVMPVKVEERLLSAMGVDLEQRVTPFPMGHPSVFKPTVDHVTQIPIDRKGIARCWQAFQDIQHLSHLRLLLVFRHMGILQSVGESYPKSALLEKLGVVPEHHALIDSLWEILSRAGFVELRHETVVATDRVENPELVKNLTGLDAKKEMLETTYPEYRAHLALLWRALEHYAPVLKGEVKSDVIYETEWDLVETYEPLFKGNALIDRLNEVAAQCVVGYIRARLPHLKKGDIIQIVEVGGGTGGATEAMVNALEPYAHKARYVFTDISAYFVHRARSKYGKGRSYTDFKVLNIENDLMAQGFEANDYDFVVANNVVHATVNIRKTVDNLKHLLKPKGNLLLNELTSILDFNTLTMGVLPGWWHFDDGELRVPHSPLLNSQGWEWVLKERGFPSVKAFAAIEDDGENYGQHIIMAESDGRVIQSAPSDGDRAIKLSEKTSNPQPPVVKKETQQNQVTLNRAQVERKVLTCFAEALNLDTNEVDSGRAFADYGVDSIIGVELINTLNTAFGITIRTTALFDYGSVKALAEYVYREHGGQLGAAVSQSSTPKPAVESQTKAYGKSENVQASKDT